MREYSSPPLDQPYDMGGHASSNLTDDLLRRAEETPDAVVASRRTPEGWAPVTARALADDVRTWAWRFVSAGLAHGDRIAILSRTRYEWTAADFGAWMVGCVVWSIGFAAWAADREVKRTLEPRRRHLRELLDALDALEAGE